jgi:hypothetical protein
MKHIEINSNQNDRVLKTQSIGRKSKTLLPQKLSRFSSQIVSNTIEANEEDLIDS